MLRAGENQVYVMNTDLRDGRQAPFYSMKDNENPESIDSILEHARLLAEAGYDVIEGGFPAGNPDEEKIIREVGKIVMENYNPLKRFSHQTVAAMAFMLNLKKSNDYRESLESAFRSIEELIQYHKGRITMLVSTAPKLREHSTGMTQAEIIENAVASTEYVIGEFAKRGGNPDLQYYVEGASQTEPDFLIEVNRAVIMAFYRALEKTQIDPSKATLVASQCETTGVAYPDHYGKLFKLLLEEIPEIRERGVILSAHCHNDRGNAVANTFKAVENGARQVEVTTLGIGERTGNADASLVLCQLTDTLNNLGVTLDVELGRLHDLALSIASITGHQINPNQPIHGVNANSTGAGIHQNAVLKNRDTYNSLDVEKFGHKSELIMLTSMSGNNAVKRVLKQAGLFLKDELVKQLAKELKKEAGQLKPNQFIRKYVARPELVRSFEKEDLTSGKMTLLKDSFNYQGSEGEQKVSFKVIKQNGAETISELLEASSAEGLVDAIRKALEKLQGCSVKLSDFYENIPDHNSVNSGSEIVIDITLEVNGMKIRGLGVSVDQNRAAAKAMINALNRIDQVTPSRRPPAPVV
jgi:2-isopropylmalate synthase